MMAEAKTGTPSEDQEKDASKKQEKKKDFPDAGPIANFVYHLPICGGFCAPTINPSSSCLRHFSNEWTPPQPCIRSRGFRGYLEHSIVARNFGKFGFRRADKFRGPILVFSFTVSLVAWFFTIYACCGLTSSKSVLRDTHWVRSVVDEGSARVYIGLSHVGVDLKNSGAEDASRLPSYTQSRLENSCGESFSFFSETYGDQVVTLVDSGDIFYDGDCSRCKSAVQSSVSLAVSSAITQVFQMTTALQRTTRFGDLNCQKLFGVMTGLYGFFSSLESLRTFRRNCGLKDDFPPWARTKSVRVELEDGSQGRVDIRMQAGLAFSFLFAAIVLKLVDIFCHLIVPTPDEKHLHPDKGTPENEDLEAYLLTAKEDDDSSSDKSALEKEDEASSSENNSSGIEMS